MSYNPFRDAQQEPPVSHCTICNGEIYPYDYCELDGSFIYCENCAKTHENNHEYRVGMRGIELDDYLNHIYGGA